MKRLMDGLRRLAALAARPPSARRNAAAVVFSLVIAGVTVAAILITRPQAIFGTVSPPGPIVAAGVESTPGPSDAEPPRRAVALPLAAISVETAPPAIIQRTVNIAPGDTLMAVMLRSGSDRKAAHAAIAALAKAYNPRRLRPGQELTLLFDPRKDGRAPLVQLAFAPNLEQEIQVSLTNDGQFMAKTIQKPLETRITRTEAVINDSLYLAAKRAGMPAPMIVELIRLYSFDVDFQRDIRPGDRFEVLFEARYDARGELAKYGDILYAKLRLGKTDLPLYRFTMQDGEVDYFNDQGHSVRKALMKTPVDGARLTSGFGRRKHPILGYGKMHRGVDFGARKGTPVMAAGNGVVEFAGRNGSFGLYLRIRHNSRYKTAYAHLSGFRRGIKRGSRVRQGQIVAYVGSTGRSTGPHLHYEILADGRQVNPLRLKLPTGRKLKGVELARFRQQHDETKKLFAATQPLTRLAERR